MTARRAPPPAATPLSDDLATCVECEAQLWALKYDGSVSCGACGADVTITWRIEATPTAPGFLVVPDR